jgi:predicted transcriptional regulator
VHSIPNIFYQVDEPDLEILRACVAEGIADADAGRLSDAEDVYARLRAHIEAIATSKTR